MSATTAAIGFGVHLSRGNGASPEVYTAIAELIDLSLPGMSRDAIEATHTDSPDGFREFLPGLKDGGEFQATCNYLPANTTQGNTSGGVLYDMINDTAARNWRITLPGAQTWTFKAIVTGYEPTTPIVDRMTLVIGFKLTGKPTLA